jgi:hypothetical protein
MSGSISVHYFDGGPEQSIIRFIDNLRLYFATKPGWTAADKIRIVEASLVGPAFAKY